MPRSHKPRRRYVPKRVELDPMGLAEARAALLPRARLLELTGPITTAFAGLRTGTGGHSAWANMADALNVAERLVALGIASDRGPEILAGQAVLSAVFQRHAATGSWTLRGPELITLQLAADIARIQLGLCSQGELFDAISTTKRCVQQALAGNASPHATVLVAGALGA